MTVSSIARRTSAVGNGVTTSFPTTFQFFEIGVYINEVRQTKGLHYSVSQSSAGGTGSVVFFVAPASGAAIRLEGETLAVQSLDYVDNGQFPASSHERAIDRLTMLSQESAAAQARSVRAISSSASLNPVDPVDVAGKLLVGSLSSGVSKFTPVAPGVVGVDSQGVPYIVEVWRELDPVTVTRESFGADSISAPVTVPSVGGAAWASQSYNSADFTGNGSMVWTVEAGDVADFSYSIAGFSMTVTFAISNAAVAGTPSSDLLIRIPSGRVAARVAFNLGLCGDAAGNEPMAIFVNAGSQYIQLRKAVNSGATWPTGVTYAYGQITFEVL